MIIYFETSAINYFSKTSSFEAAEKVFTKTQKNGAPIRTSSISFWEILFSKTPNEIIKVLSFHRKGEYENFEDYKKSIIDLNQRSIKNCLDIQLLNPQFKIIDAI